MTTAFSDLIDSLILSYYVVAALLILAAAVWLNLFGENAGQQRLARRRAVLRSDGTSAQLDQGDLRAFDRPGASRTRSEERSSWEGPQDEGWLPPSTEVTA